MASGPEMSVRRLVWREHAHGPGGATFEYDDGGHDHHQMSPYEARGVAERLGFVALQDRPEYQEWIRPPEGS